MGGLVTHVLPLNLKLDIISLLLVYVIKYIIKCSIHNKCNISFYKIVYLCVMPILFFASLKLAPCLTMKQLVHVSYTLASLSVHSLASQCRLHGTQSVCILYFFVGPTLLLSAPQHGNHNICITIPHLSYFDLIMYSLVKIYIP